ncbi:MAG: hypothetical protein WCY97_06700 [Methanothrix sp.]|jgi:hypothetical protein|uniref:Uncharacterized protein n=1 Tax=Methanothrix harundinacea TaxID=301375 RepID=A0A101IJU9_9EURY|nr:MAG: hypothetical protein XD72_1373 [Methanothrix harundinacea]MDD2637746.1 hypothetical protein [Methanothrix sp.]MDI9399782.1 hypothetical protein [Euryarchaeota archaeon]KUK96343.1 MAG: hypothetical protein XE07_1185 [Methanothrix harundinacea]MCP1391964.1 hypothetical protein [Methanothrix harundinacea]
MKCQICAVDKETLPVKAKQATIHGPKDTVFHVCKECLEAAHESYSNKEFLLKKGGEG